VGEHGTSTLNGGGGYNLIVAGYIGGILNGHSVSDAVYANMQAIMNSWKTVNSAAKYAAVIAALTSASSSTPLTAATVHSNAGDEINAGVHSLDWYFATMAGEISGEKSGETLTLC
jgi:hypothetical protein